MTGEIQFALEAAEGRIHEAIDDLKKSVKELDYALRGNGKPGLNTRVSILEWMAAGIGGFVVTGWLALLLPPVRHALWLH